MPHPPCCDSQTQGACLVIQNFLDCVSEDSNSVCYSMLFNIDLCFTYSKMRFTLSLIGLDASNQHSFLCSEENSGKDPYMFASLKVWASVAQHSLCGICVAIGTRWLIISRSLGGASGQTTCDVAMGWKHLAWMCLHIYMVVDHWCWLQSVVCMCVISQSVRLQLHSEDTHLLW